MFSVIYALLHHYNRYTCIVYIYVCALYVIPTKYNRGIDHNIVIKLRWTLKRSHVDRNREWERERHTHTADLDQIHRTYEFMIDDIFLYLCFYLSVYQNLLRVYIPFYSSQISSAMNSCFPPLAALTLKDKRRNSAYLETTGNQNTGKPNVIQDMEMFYIKQIAHNLKVRIIGNLHEYYTHVFF